MADISKIRINGTLYEIKDAVARSTSGTGTWGSITGTLSNQSDLQTVLNLKADLASPIFSGTPSAPTASVTTSSDQIATTQFVKNSLSTIVSVSEEILYMKF